MKSCKMHSYIPQRRCCWIVFTFVLVRCTKLHSSSCCICLFGLTCKISFPPPPSAMQLKPTNFTVIFISFHNTAWQTTSRTNRGMQRRYYSFWFAFQAFHSLFASSVSDKERRNYTRPLRAEHAVISGAVRMGIIHFSRGESAYFVHSSSALKSEQASSVTLDGFCAVNEHEERPDPQ